MPLYASFGVTLDGGGVDIRYPDTRKKDDERGTVIDQNRWQTSPRYYGEISTTANDIYQRMIEAADLVGGSAANVLAHVSADTTELSIRFSPDDVPILELNDALVSRLLPIGIDIDKVFVGGHALILRVENLGGVIKQYRVDITMLPQDLRMTSRGDVIPANAETEAKRKPLTETPVQERISDVDRRLGELAKRIQERVDAAKREASEKALAEEQKAKSELEKRVEQSEAEVIALRKEIKRLASMMVKKPAAKKPAAKKPAAKKPAAKKPAAKKPAAKKPAAKKPAAKKPAAKKPAAKKPAAKKPAAKKPAAKKPAAKKPAAKKPAAKKQRVKSYIRDGVRIRGYDRSVHGSKRR